MIINHISQTFSLQSFALVTLFFSARRGQRPDSAASFPGTGQARLHGPRRRRGFHRIFSMENDEPRTMDGYPPTYLSKNHGKARGKWWFNDILWDLPSGND